MCGSIRIGASTKLFFRFWEVSSLVWDQMHARLVEMRAIKSSGNYAEVLYKAPVEVGTA